jgi:hypothetical protein
MVLDGERKQVAVVKRIDVVRQRSPRMLLMPLDFSSSSVLAWPPGGRWPVRRGSRSSLVSRLAIASVRPGCRLVGCWCCLGGCWRLEVSSVGCCGLWLG